MSNIIRDLDAEIELQNALNRGDRVWVIGDVHGHSDALENILTEIDTNPGDRIVLLGDLIDRGPDARMVIRIAKERGGTFVLKGNHEDMALKGFKGNEKMTWAPPIDWLFNGGKQCLDSYRNSEGDLVEDEWIRDLSWLAQKPHVLVLDEWILAHAGVNPEYSIDKQTEDDFLWIRSSFHDSEKSIDGHRCVVFGHSITHTVLGQRIGDLGKSENRLDDGRPLWIGIDTRACDSDSGWLTAMDLSSGDIVQAKDDGTTRKRQHAFKRK
ncbi:MAG: metallophosphoesterase family protein [Candidatus Thermoplasmatota archaeon]|nr:metallophosphoesterase family protein [Candidatus Thermoplasmatota archaeon]